MTVNNAKTILFASLIVAMILPFSGMNYAEATNEDTNNYKENIRKNLPNSIKTFDLVDVSPELFKKKIENTGKVQIHFGNTIKTLSLEEFSIRAPDFDYPTTINVDGEIITLPEVKSYRGNVIGIPDSKVVMTIVDKEVSAKISIGDSIWYMESVNRYDRTASINEHYIYDVKTTRSESVPIGTSETHYPMGSGTPTTGFNSDTTEDTITDTVDTTTIVNADVLTVCDQEFWNEYGYYSYYEMEKVLNAVTENYAPLGINIQMTNIGCDSTGEYMHSTDALELLNQFKSNWQYQDTDRDIAMLFTGKDITRLNYDGFTMANVGQSNPTYGYFDESGNILALDNKLEESYAVSQMRAEENWLVYDDSPYLREINVSHEIGHLFGALHNLALDECGFSIGTLCYFPENTLMYYGITADSTDQFSDANRQTVEQNSRLYLN